MPRFPGFCGPSYQSQSPIGSIERCMNWYPERMESRYAKAPWVLYPTPGLRGLVTAGESPGRGLFAEAGRVFPMIGAKYYELSSAFALTARGTIATDQYPAMAVTNGDAGGQNFITSGNEGYIHDLTTNAFTAVVSDATMGGMLDGYFIRFDINSSTIAISDLLDGLTWDPLQFLQRSSASDPWKSILVRPPGIWAIGEKTGDVLYNKDEFPFPFGPIQGVRISQGIAAPFSLKDFSTGPIWLSKNDAGDGMVVQAQGYRPTRISTHALEWAISQYRKDFRIDDAVAFVYQDQGHEFYELNFPTAGATWVYDGATGLWHERGHWNVGLNRYEAWGPQYHTNEFGMHIVLDHRNGIVSEMSVTEYADVNGGPLRRERIAPALNDENARAFYPKFELLVQSGVGLSDAAAQGYDPKMSLFLSKDGGQTWGAERMRSMGLQGQFGTRLIWNRCGSGRDKAFKVVCTDPVPPRIIDAFLKAA